MNFMACLRSRKATVNTENLSHVRVADDDTENIQTIYTVIQEMISAAFFQENIMSPPSQMP